MSNQSGAVLPFGVVVFFPYPIIEDSRRWLRERGVRLECGYWDCWWDEPPLKGDLSMLSFLRKHTDMWVVKGGEHRSCLNPVDWRK